MANSHVLAEVFVAAFILLGLMAGSFINVVASRLPRMMEVAWRAECIETTREGGLRARIPEARSRASALVLPCVRPSQSRSSRTFPS